MAEKQSSKERMREIVDSIETGIKELFESDKYRKYLATMSRFHRYSLNNVMLIHLQRPDATLVAGFNKWRDQFGRNVMKGEKAIKIIAPTPFKKKIEEAKIDPDTLMPLLDKDGNTVMEEKEIRIPMFKVVSVFDVSQTQGKPLPQLASNLSGNVQQYEIFMEALRRSSPVPMEIRPIERDTDGYFSLTNQSITIRAGMSEVQTVCAAVHEIAHSKLHNYDQNTVLADDGETVLAPEEKDRNTEEVEAESISYAVCQYYGIETAENSFGYIATWSQGKELKELRASLETINRTASELITDIDRHFAEICKERGVDLAAAAVPEKDAIDTLAKDIEAFMLEVDTFAYLAEIGDDREASLREITKSLSSGDVRGIRNWLREVVAYEDGNSIPAQALLNRVDAMIPPAPQPEISETYDPIISFANNFAAYLVEKTGGEPIPGVPATDAEGISAWAADQLNAHNFRPLSDALLDVIAVYGQDARFDALSDRLAQLNQELPIPEAVPTVPVRHEYNLVSNFQRTAPEDTTYVQEYTVGQDHRLIPGDILYVGSYEKCLELQAALKDGSMTPEQVRALDQSEKLYVVSDSRYLHIQRTDEGFDYTLYDKATMKEIDGGQLDAPNLLISTACMEVCKLHDLDSYAVSQTDFGLIEQLQGANTAPGVSVLPDSPEQAMDEPMPDPTIQPGMMENYGYTDSDMLPLSKERAMELMERDITVYMLYQDNTEAMAFDTEDIAQHDGIFGITREDWNAIKGDIVAPAQTDVVSYRQAESTVPKELPPFQRLENHLRAAEMSMEDDYGMIDGIINNGKAPATEEHRDKKPSVLEQLRSQPTQERSHKSAPRGRKEMEI